jgi:hypothetical protein|nr:hypothetical protein [uncultured Rhodoferax sp.]
MKKIIATLLIAILAGCGTSIVKVEGDQIVNGRMKVRLPDAWNKVTLANNTQPYETWTQEGLSLDQLRLWAALPSGQSLVVSNQNTPSGQTAPRLPTFTAGMQPDQLVNLFEVMYSVDGSLVTVNKVEPTVFAGEKGVRLEFSVTRKSDGVQFGGVGWAAIRKGELFAASFVAPRLSFFPRLAPKAESVIRSAAIQG